MAYAEGRAGDGTLHARTVRAAPGIRTERIPRAGHLAHVEEPAEFAATLRRGVRRTAV